MVLAQFEQAMKIACLMGAMEIADTDMQHAGAERRAVIVGYAHIAGQ